MRWRLSLIEAATIQDGTKSVKLNDRAPTVDLRARKLINLTSIEEFSLDLEPGAAVKTTVAARVCATLLPITSSTTERFIA